MGTAPASQDQIKTALAQLLTDAGIPRVWAYMPDAFQPPGVVVQQGTIRWADVQRTFCTREWVIPLAVVVSRAHDKTGQDELDTLIAAVEAAIEAGNAPAPLEWVRLLDAEPAVITSKGTDYPGYLIRIQVVA